ncbi:hypothetical protein FRB94_009146, partial [Tulasnella sp. JGI-2019a]
EDHPQHEHGPAALEESHGRDSYGNKDRADTLPPHHLTLILHRDLRWGRIGGNIP